MMVARPNGRKPVSKAMAVCLLFAASALWAEEAPPAIGRGIEINVQLSTPDVEVQWLTPRGMQELGATGDSGSGLIELGLKQDGSIVWRKKPQ